MHRGPASGARPSGWPGPPGSRWGTPGDPQAGGRPVRPARGGRRLPAGEALQGEGHRRLGGRPRGPRQRGRAALDRRVRHPPPGRDRALRIRARKRSAEDEAARDERLHRQRSCRTWTDPADGSFRLDARLTPMDGARLASRSPAGRRPPLRGGQEGRHHESPDAYAADALVGLVCGDDRKGRHRGPVRGARAGGGTHGMGVTGATFRGRWGRPWSRRGDHRRTRLPPRRFRRRARPDEIPTGCPGGCRNDSVHVRIDLDALRRAMPGGARPVRSPGWGPSRSAGQRRSWGTPSSAW